MMELSFKSSGLLQNIDANPTYIIFVSAFGIPVLILLLALIRKILGQKDSTNIDNLFLTFYISLTITWILGTFASIILYFNIEVSGVQFLLILFSIFLCMDIFALTNRAYIKKCMDELAPQK